MKTPEAVIEQYKALGRAVGRLKFGKTDKSRRKARRLVTVQVNKLKAAIDEAFPAPKRKVRKGRAKPSVAKAVVGHQLITNNEFIARAVQVGVSLQRRVRPSFPPAEVQQTYIYAPNWYVALAKTQATTDQLKRALNDLSFRKAQLAALTLSNLPSTL